MAKQSKGLVASRLDERPNPSIKATFSGKLRLPTAALHAKRYV
jgi:hypothetical protein